MTRSMAALMIALSVAGISPVAAQAVDEGRAGDRRGRIGAREGDRVNDRLAQRATESLADPLARGRTPPPNTTTDPREAITTGRVIVPR